MANPQTVLIVDDNPMQLAVLYEFLRQKEYRVLVAESGEQAIESASLAMPDVILLDILLPGIDGYETLKILRNNPYTARIPVAFMSALEDNTAKSRSFLEGAVAHLTRPILYEEVLSVIETQFRILQLEDKTTGEQTSEGLAEVMRYIDYAAHDINNPITNLLGFAYELREGFAEAEIPAEWLEYLAYIEESGTEIQTITQGLVLLKNLVEKRAPAKESVDLQTALTHAQDRFEAVDTAPELELQTSLEEESVVSDPILLEELLSILLNNFPALNEGNDALQVTARSHGTNDHRVQLSLEGPSRTLKDSELPSLLNPIIDGKRTKVPGTNLLLVCAQKIIQLLALEAACQKTHNGLIITLIFPPSSRPTDR